MKPTYELVMQALDPKYPPTSEQRDVVVSDSPAILVVAGAGSGKTATMTKRIAYQLAIGTIQPHEVLGLTFTTKAAGELAERVENALSILRQRHLIGQGSSESSRGIHESLMRPTIATYNSFASGIASSYGMLIGADSRARLITDAERYQVMASIVDSYELFDGASESFATASRTSLITNSLVLAAGLIDNRKSINEAREFFDSQIFALDRLEKGPSLEKGIPGAAEVWRDLLKARGSLELRRDLLRIVERYFEHKKAAGLLEFADQVAMAGRVCEEFPEIGTEIASRYKLILLDEYQDTSVNQAKFLLDTLAPATLPPGYRSICAVGDPQQAIYGWRGASANALADFATEFGQRLGGIHKLHLSISFRNDEAILAAANAVSGQFVAQVRATYDDAPADTTTAQTGVEPHQAGETPSAATSTPTSISQPLELRPRPGAGPGLVSEIRTWFRDDHYRAIARRIRDVMRHARDEGREAEIAVLCRKREYIDDIVEALTELDIPYEVIGGESLVVRPEILTIRSALGLIANPRRNDLLMRLLTLFGVGIDDVRILRQVSRSAISREVHDIYGAPQDSPVEYNLVELLAGFSDTNSRLIGRSIDDESAELTHGTTYELDASWTVNLSGEGARKLQHVATILRELRAHIHSPLPNIVALASRLLGIDVATASRAKGERRVRTSLDSFVTVASDFAKTHPGCRLSDFVEWLDAVEAHEHGGEEESGTDITEDVEVHSGVVQIMTIHASKGLEWNDLVVVPELVGEQFSVVGRVEAWPQNTATFPFPLRTDYPHLPHFSLEHFANRTEAAQAYSHFKKTDLPEHGTAEARRLAYVAFTRPRSELLLAGYALARRELPRIRPGIPLVPILPRSIFLTDILDHAFIEPPAGHEHEEHTVHSVVHPISELAGSDWPPEFTASVPDQITLDELTREVGELPQAHAIKEVPDYAHTTLPRWPHDLLRGQAGANTTPSRLSPDIAWQVDELIAEYHSTSSKQMERPYYTATDMVRLIANPDEFTRNQLRPIPQQPSTAARLGNAIHARIAQSFSGVATLDIDELLEPLSESYDEETLTTAEEDKLFQAFEASPWSRYPAIAIEQPLEIVVQGRILRCTIDAVLDTSADPDRAPITIVDWKSGRRPTAAQLPARELQLAIYRLAWARTHNVELDNIDACFVYLREAPELRDLRAGHLSEQEIESKIADGFAQGTDE
ncbi:UvrD-helicase domain-containing protein [Arcanobacterium haemolyticum]|nr:UvrD-helicase domain-containing protein [Arcanobacterium haemolyticum]